MQKSFKKMALMLTLLSTFLLATGCGDTSASSGGGANITLSGSISSTPFIQARMSRMSDNGTMAVTLTDLEIYVVYFSGTSVGVVQATLDGSGNWSFDVPRGSQINAIVRNKNDQELLGPITFVDARDKDMSGNDKETTTYSFKTGASLGAIELSADGKFKVDATAPSIVDAANTLSKAPDSAIDFSGSWVLGTYSGAIPSGYSGACPAGSSNRSSECHGPEVGEAIYLARLSGKKFSYTGGNCATFASAHTGACAATDGTVSDIDVDAAQIWGGGAAVQACGFKTGFSADDARAFGRIHIAPADLPMISGTGVTVPTQMSFGRVTFTTPAGYGTNGGDAGPNNLPWMKGGATSNYDIMECTNVSRTGSDSKVYNLNVCKGTIDVGHGGGVGYQAMGPNGCVDAAGKPVIIYNWGGLVGGVCPGQTAHPALANMYVNSCSYTGVSGAVASAAAFTCTNVYGTFTNAAATAPAAAGAYLASFLKVNSGSLCSAIVDDLQRYRCYANAYFQDGGNRNSGGCSTEYRFNWQAQTAANFVQVDESRDKPKQQYLTSVVTYSPDGKSFTLEDEQGESVSVQVDTSSIVCRIAAKTVLKGTALPGTTNKMLIDLSQSAYLKDTTIASCVSEKNNSTANGGHGTELYQRLQEGNAKFLFTLTKQ